MYLRLMATKKIIRFFMITEEKHHNQLHFNVIPTTCIFYVNEVYYSRVSSGCILIPTDGVNNVVL